MVGPLAAEDAVRDAAEVGIDRLHEALVGSVVSGLDGSEH
jgi:hypothetical protein